MVTSCYLKVHGEVSSRYKQKTTSMGVEALKEALQEKQQHVESLLAERDMERNEMVEVNIAVAKKQTQLVKMQEMHEGVSLYKLYHCVCNVKNCFINSVADYSVSTLQHGSFVLIKKRNCKIMTSVTVFIAWLCKSTRFFPNFLHLPLDS